MTDEDPHNPGVRHVRFWVDEAPSSPEDSRSHVEEELTTSLANARDVSRAPMTPERRDRSRGSPDFGGGVGYSDNGGHHRGVIESLSTIQKHIPENDRPSPPRSPNQPRIPPEHQVPRGCSLHSMEPLREWFCKGADVT